MKTLEQHGMMSAVLTGVVALVIGLGGGYALCNMSDSDDSSTAKTSMSMGSTSTKAAELRSNMVALGIEHMILTDQAVGAALDGAKNADATGAALYKNGTDIGAAVGSVYGTDAEKTFNTVWKLHLDEFVKYAVASSKADDAGKKMALEIINSQYTKPLAAYLAKANPNLPQDALESGLNDHVFMTATMIDYHVKGDYTAEAAELTKANEHIKGLFNTLADGIVKQYPDKF